MRLEILKLMENMQFSEPADNSEIEDTERNLGIRFTEQYKEFLRKTDGAEGPIGKNGYMSLWPIKLVGEINSGSKTRSFLPGLIMFGSDGGDETYAFDYNNKSVILDVPFAACDMEETEVVAETFEEFIKKQSEQ